ncbi:MAG TPA: ATP-binding protein, partial [Albitalea sp.]
HEALARAMAEKANHSVTGHSHFEIEAREALERAEGVLVKARELLQHAHQQSGDAYHARFLARQEAVLERTRQALAEADRALAAGGPSRSIEPLRGVFATEVEADELRHVIMTHHQKEQGENAATLRVHGRDSFYLILATAAACSLWTGLLVVYVRQRIVTPITALSELTARMAAGDLSTRAAVTHTDEIGRLQTSFNQMVVQVAQKQRELEASREHLARSRDVAEAANKAKSEFLANVSHELRTPMNGIIVTLDLMHETASEPEQRDLAELARASAHGLRGMLNDLLDLSRIEAGKVEIGSVAFEPHQLLAQMVELHGRRAAAKGLHVSCSVADDVPSRLTGDPLRVGQILLNLLDNAIKFTERGSIGVNVTREATPASDDDAVMLRFEVADTGIGVPAAAAARLFQPFYQADGMGAAKYGGLGLGLGIAQHLARMMGGELDFRSQPGEGSTFWFTVRLRTERRCIAHEPSGKAHRRYEDGAAVLLVEDNRDTREVMARVLERRGLRVSIAEDGCEALELAGRQDFDIVLMDCQMPRMDGFAATRAIRQMGGTRARVPIIALTAYGVTGTKRYVDAGFNDLVAKPYTMQEVDEALCRWLVPRADAGSPGAVATSA